MLRVLTICLVCQQASEMRFGHRLTEVIRRLAEIPLAVFMKRASRHNPREQVSK
jgi:hypothetical protein